jgi:hypothetical protein
MPTWKSKVKHYIQRLVLMRETTCIKLHKIWSTGWYERMSFIKRPQTQLQRNAVWSSGQKEYTSDQKSLELHFLSGRDQDHRLVRWSTAYIKVSPPPEAYSRLTRGVEWEAGRKVSSTFAQTNPLRRDFEREVPCKFWTHQMGHFWWKKFPPQKIFTKWSISPHLGKFDHVSAKIGSKVVFHQKFFTPQVGFSRARVSLQGIGSPDENLPPRANLLKGKIARLGDGRKIMRGGTAHLLSGNSEMKTTYSSSP